jgi:CHU_C Type IX secretion signal domain
VRPSFYVLLLLLSVLSIGYFDVRGTHLRAADVKVERNCGTRSFKITVIAYLNTGSNTRFGTNSQVYFGDGSFVDIPVTIATVRPDLGENIAIATFTTTHNYSSDGIYNIAYIERDRSSGVLNIVNSDDVPYVTFVKINTDPAFGCNNFPVLNVSPLDRACKGVAFFHTSGAFDIDGDSLSYALTLPGSGIDTQAGYTAPNDRSFYTNFNTGNEAGTGQPIFQIDPLTGLVTWDAPGRVGEYNIAFHVIEWRKLADGTYARLSTSTRDMQIVVEDCLNTRPELIIPADICVVAGTNLSRIVKGRDADGHNVKIEVFSELLLLSPPATYTPVHTDFVSSVPDTQVTFSWQTDCTHIRSQVYQVVFKITDNPPLGPKLTAFKTWNIKVVAPAPVWDDVKLDVVNLHADLSIKDYACDNATAIQVWRKVDSFPYSPGSCALGIPGKSGYQLIDVLPGDAQQYKDTNFGNGLVPAATYCYRLVALVNDAKSYVSQEFCVGPVRADAPVITHVSVIKTASQDGEIQVRWRSPFDMDRDQFPEPYEYEAYRAKDFIGETNIAQVARTRDLTFVNTPVNSREDVHNFRVVVYSQPDPAPDFIPIDTSAVASTVRLDAVSDLPGTVVLHWRDSVPWSNVVFQKPYHLIYRSEGPEPNEENMTLIDSVNVIEDGFVYVDIKAVKNSFYHYKVLTRGTYGNPLIPIQENFSQLVSIYPSNDFPVCPPLVTIDKMDCSDYVAKLNCGTGNIFSNVLRLQPDDTRDCRIDVVSYKIYAAEKLNGEYLLIATFNGGTFTEPDLPSMARCYRVATVDGRGIESEPGEPVCNDNCPFFELPNVFSPNGDGCNDRFTANYDANSAGTACEPVDRTRCPRFVKALEIKIYSRWGRLVHTYNSNEAGSVYIDWDGKDENGNDCSTGVYYYTANVAFDVLDTEQQKRTFKGSIHLIK